MLVPEEDLRGKCFVKESDTGRRLIKNEASLLVRDVLCGRGVRSSCIAALAAHELVHGGSDWLEATADTSFLGDQGHRLAFEVPLRVLKAHPVDLFVDMRAISHGYVVGTQVSYMRLVNMSPER